MASLGPALRNILAIKIASASVPATSKPTIITTEFDITILRLNRDQQPVRCLPQNQSAVWGAPWQESRRKHNHWKSGVRMSQFVPSAHVGHATFITDHDNLRSAFDGTTVVAARCAGAASSGLREDDLADAVGAAYSIAHTRDHAGHLSV